MFLLTVSPWWVSAQARFTWKYPSGYHVGRHFATLFQAHIVWCFWSLLMVFWGSKWCSDQIATQLEDLCNSLNQSRKVHISWLDSMRCTHLLRRLHERYLKWSNNWTSYPCRHSAWTSQSGIAQTKGNLCRELQMRFRLRPRADCCEGTSPWDQSKVSRLTCSIEGTH